MKKNKKKLIIIALILISIISLFIYFLAESNQNVIDSTDYTEFKDGEIVNIYVNEDVIYAQIEDYLYMLGDSGDFSANEIVLITDNVKDFYYGDNYSKLFYTDAHDNLYYSSGDDEFNFLFDNIKYVDNYQSAVYMITKTNELYALSFDETDNCGGLNENFIELSYIASNVKYAYVSLFYGGYVTNENDMYVKISNEDEYSLIGSDILSINTSGKLILDETKKLYFLNYDLSLDTVLLDEIEYDVDENFIVYDGEYLINVFDTSENDDIYKIVYESTDVMIYLNYENNFIITDNSSTLYLENGLSAIYSIYNYFN